MSSEPLAARAVAHSNIALAKYWGKADVERNLPAVPSLSMTLEAMFTETQVVFDTDLAEDEVRLDDAPATGKAKERVCALLDQVRARAGVGTRARVTSHNNFPTAAGLASSASGFAALALAASRAAQLELPTADVSALARQASASAARSLYGGYVVLEAGADSATQLAPAAHWPLVMVVALTATGAKPIGSTEAMKHTRATSPYYPAWISEAPRVFERATRAVLDRDLATLGAAVEHSALLMHASMLGADPPVMYFQPGTFAVLAMVRELRESGLPAFATMDAGPHVKILTEAASAQAVAAAVGGVPGVHRVFVSAIGPDASLVPATQGAS